MPDLPVVLVLLDGTEALLERCFRIDAVQVVETDPVRPQPSEAPFDLASQHLGMAAVPASFGRDDAAVRDGRESSPDRLFALSSGVRVGGVDQVHASGDRFLHEGDMLGRIGQPVRPEPDTGDLGMAEPELRGRVHGPHATTSISVSSVGSIVIETRSTRRTSTPRVTVAPSQKMACPPHPFTGRLAGVTSEAFRTLLVLGWRSYIGRKRDRPMAGACRPPRRGRLRDPVEGAVALRR